MEETSIKNIMTREVQCMSPKTPLSHVIQAMRENCHSCMIIVENQTPVGIITERDIVRHVTDLIRRGQDYDPDVASIMSTNLITLHENADLFEALVIAKSNKIRHLPVVNSQGQLVGLITHTDLVRDHLHIIETQTAILERAIANRTQELMEVNKKLRDLSLEDPLLEIGNRRAMEVDLNHTHSVSRRYGRQYMIVLFDVDYFKLYNDRYGHVAGDGALKQVAAFIKGSIRKTDRVYRYGGEELLLLLPETSSEGAYMMGQRLISGIVELGIPHEQHPLKILTLSGGTSGPDETVDKETWLHVVHRADYALYEAKNQGRNRIASLYSSSLVLEPTPVSA